MDFMPDASEVLKCLPALVGEVSAAVVEAARTYHVTNGTRMTNVQCAALVISDQTSRHLYITCPGHLQTPGRRIIQLRDLGKLC